MQLKKLVWKITTAALIGMLANSAMASPVVEQPKLVIIIDNLGDQEQPGLKVANLPDEVACSILPHGRFSAQIAELCHAKNKTVILNTPMQAENNYPLGAGGLHAGMPKQEFIKTLMDDMASVPYIQGLDNHMGSLLTAKTQPMNWLMQTIKPHGLFFLDNKTSPHSVVESLAKANQVSYIGRDVFLDDQRTPAAVHKQFSEALQIAKRYGVAIVVAHPYAVTLDYLQATLPHLSAQGYQLVSMPDILNIHRKPITLTVAKSVIPAINPIVKTAVNKKPAENIIEKPLGVKNNPVPSANKNIIVELPVITGKTSQAPIELTVNKDHQVVINAADQPATIAKIETTQLVLPTDNAAKADAKIPHKPGLFVRLKEKFSHYFQHEKTEPAKMAAKPIKTTEVDNKRVNLPAATKTEAIVIPAIKPDDKAQKNVVVSVAPTMVAAQETTKASHSLIQTLKDNLCKKYSHFCGHPEPIVADEKIDFAHTAFTNLQGKLHWPTAGNVTTHFGTELGNSQLKYDGVLIQAPEGQPVHAIYQGRVIFANWLHGLGLLLIIDHGNGYMSLYGHNQSLYKKAGDTVKPNELIASVGNSGAPGPTGLYFEIRHNGQPVNPEQWCG